MWGFFYRSSFFHVRDDLIFASQNNFRLVLSYFAFEQRQGHSTRAKHGSFSLSLFGIHNSSSEARTRIFDPFPHVHAPNFDFPQQMRILGVLKSIVCSVYVGWWVGVGACTAAEGRRPGRIRRRAVRSPMLEVLYPLL